MTAVTGWQGGRLNSGLGWTGLFGSETATMSNATAVLSSVSITNGTSLDQFMDVSLEATLSTNTIAAGANFTLWTMALMEDGTTYGDNSISTSPAAITPGLFPVAIMSLRAAASQTALYGYAQGIILPPGTFSGGLQNNCGFTLTGCTVKYRSYNINLSNTS